MSQYPPYPPSDPGMGNVPNYYGGAMPNPRPASVTGIAITGIILGSLGLLCTGSGALISIASLSNGGKNPLAPQLPPMDHNIVLFSVFQSSFNLLLALTLLICCIAALSLRPIARKVLIPWAALSIVWWIVIMIVQLTWTGPQTQKTLQAMPGYNPTMQSAQQIGMVIGAVGMPLAMCVVPVLILILWNRPHVKAAFGEMAAPGFPPNQFPPNQFPPTGYPPNYPGQ